MADRSKKLLAVAAAAMVRTPIGAGDRLQVCFCAILLPVKADRRRLGSAVTVLMARGRSADPLARAERFRHEHRIAVAIVVKIRNRNRRVGYLN